MDLALLHDLHTCYPATIVEFDPVEQVATVELALEKYYSGIDTTQMYEEFTRPVIQDVPVHFPQCAGFSLTMPVKAGSACLVLFAQRGINHWLLEGKKVAGRDPVTGYPAKEHSQRFDVNSALAIVGFNPIPEVIKDFSADDTEWRNSDRSTRITLLADGAIEVVTPTSVTTNCATAVVNATTSCTFDTPLSTFTGNVQVDGSVNANVNINAGAMMGAPAISAPGPGPFYAPREITPLDGTVTIQNGLLTASADVVGGGKSLVGHTHMVTVTSGSSSGSYETDTALFSATYLGGME